MKNDLRVLFSFIEVEFVPIELYEVCLFYYMHVSYCDRVCKIFTYKLDEFYIKISSRGFKCCAGTQWIEKTSTCESKNDYYISENFKVKFNIDVFNFVIVSVLKECPLGFHDANCSKPCDFPFFGEDCQSKCNCIQSKCDHAWGCSELSSTF